MELSDTNLVGPREEDLESTKPFWSFFLLTSKWKIHMSFPRELCTCGGYSKGGSMNTMLLGGCSKGGSMDTMLLGDAIREVHLYHVSFPWHSWTVIQK
jgi:hypothetical protein